MKYSYPIMHWPNMHAICIHTIRKHTPRCDPHTWCTNKSNAYIVKHTPQVFCLNVIHVKSKHAYVCLLKSGRSVRRKLSLAARIIGCTQGQGNCGEEGGKETVRVTLFRHRSAFGCTSVRVRTCQCDSAVQVCAYLKKQPRQSSTRVKGRR